MAKTATEALMSQDLRVQKTQRALVLAMITLLDRQSFSKITVNDLCAEALVSRSAFYSHFVDKYALLRFCLEVVTETAFKVDSALDLKENLRLALTSIENESRNIFKNLIMSDYDSELDALLLRFFRELIEAHLKSRGVSEDTLPGPLDIISVYYAGGITTAVKHWVRHDMPYSVEEMCACLAAIVPSEL